MAENNKIKTRFEQNRCLCTENKEKQRWIEQTPGRIRDKLIEFGLLDANRSAAAKTLDKHIEDFEKHLLSKERSQKHLSMTISTVKGTFDSCGFKYFSDISAEKLKSFLDGLRDGGNGISKRTYNRYLTVAKMFCKWLVKERRAPVSPIDYLDGLDNLATDRRHERRAATPDELRRLLESTNNAPERYGMSGYERMLLYRFAAETGLRANEIRTLTKAAFDFEKLTVKIEAGYSKHRRIDVQPLRPELAAMLKEFFKTKMPSVRLFGGRYKQLTDKTAVMLRADLADAGIPYIDDNGRVLDFHGLRHTFITNLHKAPSRVAQSLARHRSSAMTDRYTHIRLHDERAALNTLPDLSLPSSRKQKATKTGTDDSGVTEKILSKSCFTDAQLRTTIDNNGLTNLDTAQKTPLCVTNEGVNRFPKPKVAGSNPAWRSSKDLENREVTELLQKIESSQTTRKKL